jgi:hypothetical protein
VSCCGPPPGGLLPVSCGGEVGGTTTARKGTRTVQTEHQLSPRTRR